MAWPHLRPRPPPCPYRAVAPPLDVTQIQVVVTNAAKNFTDLDHLKQHLGVAVWTDEDEWGHWKKAGDPIAHIDLMRWADVLLVAPLSANTLAKIAGGLADNLVTCVLRAWPIANIAAKPVFVAPAMNTNMWDHPMTSKHLDILREELRFHVIPPISKVLACGDYGNGAMEEVVNIAKIVRDPRRLQVVHLRADPY